MFSIIPAIDILGGKVTRLTQGDYEQTTFFDTDPVTLAKYFESCGAKRLHLVDLDGAKDGELVNLDVFKAIREAVSMELELGGGIRTLDAVTTLVNIGIDYIILGSLLVKDKPLSERIIKEFPNKVIAGIDLKNNKVAIEGWLEDSSASLEPLLDWLNGLPIESIICTDISKDGMMQGPNVTLYDILSKMTSTPLIASGGVSNLADIEQLKTVSDSLIGCVVGKALLSGAIPPESCWN